MMKSSCTGAPIFRPFSMIPAAMLLMLLTSTLCLGASDEFVVVKSSSPLHAKLASIEKGGYVVRQSDINTWEAILNRLDFKCSQDTREMVGNLILTSQKMLKDRGKEMKLRDVARILDESIPHQGTGLLDCKTMFSTTITREVTNMSRLKLDEAPY